MLRLLYYKLECSCNFRRNMKCAFRQLINIICAIAQLYYCSNLPLVTQASFRKSTKKRVFYVCLFFKGLPSRFKAFKVVSGTVACIRTKRYWLPNILSNTNDNMTIFVSSCQVNSS